MNEITQNAAPELLNYRQVAARYGLKIGTLYALVHQRRIPHVRFGRRFVRFRPSDVEVWIASRAIECALPSDPPRP